MNKSQIVDYVASSADITKAAADRAVSAFVKAVIDSVAKGEDVTLVGFGTFYSRKRAARQGRNPRTGAPLTIAASKLPGFRAGSSFKETVNGN